MLCPIVCVEQVDLGALESEKQLNVGLNNKY